MAEDFRRDQHRALISEAKDNLGKIPPHFRAGLARYLDGGVPPGSFLCAVLDNDLSRAVGLAASVEQLPILCAFIYTHFPREAWGSSDARHAWQTRIGELMTERDTEPAPAPLVEHTEVTLTMPEAVGG